MQHWGNISICRCRRWSWNIRNRAGFRWLWRCVLARRLFGWIRTSIGCLLAGRRCGRWRIRSLAGRAGLLCRRVGIRLCAISLFGCFFGGSMSRRYPRSLGYNSIYGTWCGTTNRKRTDYTANENSWDSLHTQFSKCPWPSCHSS